MINRKLLAISAVFLALAMLMHFYSIYYPKPVAQNSTSYLAKMSEIIADELLYNIDLSYPIEDGFYLSGWAVMPEVNSKEFSVAISVCSEHGEWMMSTTKTERTDVSDVLESELYKNSGFYVVFDMTGLSDNLYSIRIYIINETNKTYFQRELPLKIQYHNRRCEIT